jgi:hypothetical protein
MILRSESRRPGMGSQRRCLECRTPLDDDETADRCSNCQPRLSAAAREIGAHRAEMRTELAAQEREADQIKHLIRRMERALRKWLT